MLFGQRCVSMHSFDWQICCDGVCRGVVGAAAEVRNLERGNFPLSAALLRKCLNASTGLIGIGAQFKEMANCITKAPAAHAFPTNVEYPTCCGELCLQTSPPTAVQAYLDLLSGFTQLAKKWSNDLLIMVTRHYDNDPDGVDFVLMPHILGRSGIHPAEQTFVCLRVVEYGQDGGIAGTQLEIVFMPRVVPLKHCRSPIDQQE